MSRDGKINRGRSLSYYDKVKQQIKQYAHVENMHASLPDVQQYYQQKYNRDRSQALFGVSNYFEFYAKPLISAIKQTKKPDVISIGSGDGAVELGVAKLLNKAGVEFQFHLLELSPIQLDRARDRVSAEGLLDHFSFLETDLNNWEPSQQYAGAMAHHSLHHVVNLEHLFDGVKSSVLGCFCTMDMIGRNGHMRWPEVLEIVQRFWDILPAEKRKHRVLPNFEDGFYNHDCSTEGFEGIRAQDILPCLVDRFGFEAFYAYGGLVDPFVSRGFGHHYDMSKDWDRSFIDLVASLNDILLECGYIKPTQMHAVMNINLETVPRVYRNRTPEFCIRNQSSD